MLSAPRLWKVLMVPCLHPYSSHESPFISNPIASLPLEQGAWEVWKCNGL